MSDRTASGGDLVIRRARISGEPVDVRIAGGRIAEIHTRVTRPAGVDELEAGGGWLIPGLHDHHIHLRSLVAARTSVRSGPPEVTDNDALVAALQEAARGARPGGWVRAVGYHESVAGDLDRDDLDRWVLDTPVRVQHRSGILWVLNSAALSAVGAESAGVPGVERDAAGRPTGRLWRMDRWLAERTSTEDGFGMPDTGFRAGLGQVSAEAAAAGVVGWTDATPGRSDDDAGEMATLVADGVVMQRLHLMLRPSGTEQFTTGRLAADRVTAGPVKLLFDDRELPAFDTFVGLISDAHDKGRPVAVHCVTRTQLVLFLAVLEAAGGSLPGDRVEHGAVIPEESVSELSRMGVTVVTQPNFVAERGDEYLHDVVPEDLPDLWRARSLVDGGVSVAAGSDAPFGDPDPWRAIRAASSRMTPKGRCLGPRERVDLSTGLGWWLGTGSDPAKPRSVEVGQAADLVVLGETLEDVLHGHHPAPVTATIVAGKQVFAIGS